MTIPHGSEARIRTASRPVAGRLAAAPLPAPASRSQAQPRRWHALVAPIRTTLVPVALLAATLSGATVAVAGPMQCITSLEAPTLAASGAGTQPAAPVEVTRCAPVETPPQLLERRAYTWSTSYARGVDLLHQVTDLLGIAMGGRDGTQVMGFGFQDQALIWDGSAIENTAAVLIEEQFTPVPLRTADLPSVFSTSLGSGPQGLPAGGGL
ncbi:MAG: Occludin/ELL family protein [Cyanobium sp.]